MSEAPHEVALIGAGPIGLEMAVALIRAGIDYIHFDARQIGHTVSWFAPGTRFFSSNERIAIAGVPLQSPDQSKSTREQYLAYLRMIVEMFDLPIKTFERVTEIRRDETSGPSEQSQFLLQTQKGDQAYRYRARNIILATGGTERPRQLAVPGENLPHVSHYFQDPHLYFRTDLLIVGGRNSAAEAALRCCSAGARVTISYYKPELAASDIKYWIWPELSSLIQSGKIKFLPSSRVKEILPRSVKLHSDSSGNLEISNDFVLALIGYESDQSLCKMAGVQLDPKTESPAFDPQTMQTNVPGIYVAGTAIGGTQKRFTVFIENCHVHIQKIIAAIRHDAPPLVNPEAPIYQRPES